MSETKKEFKLKSSEEAKKIVASFDEKKSAERIAKKRKSKLWNWVNAILNYATAEEAKEAETDKRAEKLLMRDLRKKLRSDQSELGHKFLTAYKTKAKNLEETYNKFAEFNNKYIIDCKTNYSQVSEKENPEQYKFLKELYTVFNNTEIE